MTHYRMVFRPWCGGLTAAPAPSRVSAWLPTREEAVLTATRDWELEAIGVWELERDDGACEPISLDDEAQAYTTLAASAK